MEWTAEDQTIGQRRRALVVDDDPGVQRLVSRMLATHGLRVDRAGDGEEGLRRAVATSYDIVVLDLHLPRLDGMTVLRRLMSTRPRQAVIVCSCQSDLATRSECVRVGARGLVAKPFSFSDLSSSVLAALAGVDWVGSGR